MGMTANQLLSKALSTESEGEAIACLKMARKKGLKLDVDITKGYYDKKLKDHAIEVSDLKHIISELGEDINDKLRLNTLQRKEIHYLEDKLQRVKDRLYTYEAWLILAYVAIAAELLVIILLANGG